MAYKSTNGRTSTNTTRNTKTAVTRSILVEWADIKTEYILKQVDKFHKDKDEKTLSRLNTHPVYIDYLCYFNDNEMTKERSFTVSKDIYYCLRQFQKIMARINMKDVFVPSIENFCMFMGITARMYNQLLNSTSTQQKEIMQTIEDYIIDSQLSAGQKGIASSSLSKFRTQVSGDHGNSLVTQKEQNENTRAENRLKSKEELLKELKSMGAGQLTAKQLTIE